MGGATYVAHRRFLQRLFHISPQDVSTVALTGTWHYSSFTTAYDPTTSSHLKTKHFSVLQTLRRHLNFFYPFCILYVSSWSAYVLSCLVQLWLWLWLQLGDNSYKPFSTDITNKQTNKQRTHKQYLAYSLKAGGNYFELLLLKKNKNKIIRLAKLLHSTSRWVLI